MTDSAIINLSKTVPTQPFVARVNELNLNKIVSVLWNGLVLPIEFCMQSLLQFKQGDHVLVQPVEEGFAVVQQFQGKETNLPTLHQDQDGWRLECPRAFQLKVGLSRLEISETGQVVLEGEDITSYATGANRVIGQRIELN